MPALAGAVNPRPGAQTGETLTARYIEKGPWPDARLRLYIEATACTSIVLLLLGAAGPQVIKMAELRGKTSPAGLEFWTDLSGALGMLGAVATLLALALSPMRNWWLGRQDPNPGHQSEMSVRRRNKAAAGIMLSAMAGAILMLTGAVLEKVIARSGHDIGLTAGDWSWAGLLFPAGLTLIGFAAAAAIVLLSQAKAAPPSTDADTTA